MPKKLNIETANKLKELEQTRFIRKDKKIYIGNDVTENHQQLVEKVAPNLMGMAVAKRDLGYVLRYGDDGLKIYGESSGYGKGGEPEARKNTEKVAKKILPGWKIRASDNTE